MSLLQSVPCVYYRSTVGGDTEIRGDRSGYTEERSIGFRVRDATGSLRVFPRGAGFDAPVRFEVEADMVDEAFAGLDIRHGGSTRPAEIDKATAAAALLTVDPHATDRPAGLGSGGRRSYKERRLEPGDPVTIVGRALPFSDLADPAGADLGSSSDPLGDDPEVAADLAEARADGTLVDDPAAAWGNAAIPGFGIGRPVVAPSIDAAAHPLPLADAGAAARAERTFRIAPETLVLAASDEVPLLIAYGLPGNVVGRGQDRFVLGLLGAILAIGSAMVFAVSLTRGRFVSAPEAAAAFAVGLLVAIGAFIAFTSYNAVVALRQRIDKAWSNIDVVLKQRHDQLPNLVAAVRGLMEFERDVLTRVTEARAAVRPVRADPRPGGRVRGDQRRRPLAVRGGRALPGHQVGRQRRRPAGRDRASRGDDRRPARALQRPGLSLQHAHRAGPGRPAGTALRLAPAGVLRGRTR